VGNQVQAHLSNNVVHASKARVLHKGNPAAAAIAHNNNPNKANALHNKDRHNSKGQGQQVLNKVAQLAGSSKADHKDLHKIEVQDHQGQKAACRITSHLKKDNLKEFNSVYNCNPTFQTLRRTKGSQQHFFFH
jgi:hypothetical protein